MSRAERIRDQVLAWDGVTVRDHRFGGLEFRLGRRELGHLHGDQVADLRFHKTVRDMLVETGRAAPHRVLPSSGWVSRTIRDEQDVDDVVALFRLSYERARVAERRAER